MPNVFIKKPHHRQEHDMSCLAACSKMLLDFTGNITAEKALRDLLHTDAFGTVVANILVLNTALPETKTAIHRWPLSQLQNYLITKQRPCIVTVKTGLLPHWKGQDCAHALVVHGFGDEYILVNDPHFEDEEFRIMRDAFVLAWTELGNVVITIERR